MDAIEKLMSEYGISKFPTDTAYAMAYVPFQKNNPKISAVSKNISDLNRSYQTVGRAIEIALGVVTQKKK